MSLAASQKQAPRKPKTHTKKSTILGTCSSTVSYTFPTLERDRQSGANQETLPTSIILQPSDVVSATGSCHWQNRQTDAFSIRCGGAPTGLAMHVRCWEICLVGLFASGGAGTCPAEAPNGMSERDPAQGSKPARLGICRFGHIFFRPRFGPLQAATGRPRRAVFRSRWTQAARGQAGPRPGRAGPSGAERGLARRGWAGLGRPGAARAKRGQGMVRRGRAGLSQSGLGRSGSPARAMALIDALHAPTFAYMTTI